VIVGERTPSIEFVDYSSNTATKEYILHAHGLIGGNVYLKTRTSNETITIPYNSDASAVESLFEATSDCVSATATGGPWPLLPIAIEVEWSARGGDVSAIATTGTQSAVGGGSEWLPPVTGNIAEGIDYLRIEMITVSVGTTLRFSLAAGLHFDYASETDDVDTFILQLEAAMEEFAEDQGSDSAWEYIAAGFPDSIETSGSSLTIYYSTELGIDPMTVEIIAGGDEITDSRSTRPAAIAYSTSTGEMTSSVGYRFGFSEASPPAKIFEESGGLPTVTGLNVLGISAIGSGPSNTVILTPAARGSGDSVKASVIETWAIDGDEWAQEWQVFCNAEMTMPDIIMCESGYVICPINAKRFGDPFTGNDRTAARISVADGSIVELVTNFASVLPPNNNVLTAMYDDTPSSYFSWAYDSLFTDPDRPNNTYRTNDDGSDTDADGTLLRIGGDVFGADSSSIFATSNGALTKFSYEQSIAPDHLFYYWIWPAPTVRSAEPQQFRLRFANGQATAWLDWYATQEEFLAAIIDVIGENLNAGTPGYESNAVIVMTGATVGNNPISQIERGMQFQFLTDYGYSPGSHYAPWECFSTRVGDVRVEVQTVTPFAAAGIAGYDASDASLLWSRPFGAKGTITVSKPLYAWLQGDFVYAYGQLVDNEL